MPIFAQSAKSAVASNSDCCYDGSTHNAVRRRGTPAGRPRVLEGSVGVLFDERETPRFIDAVRKIKEEQRKTERKAREAKQKVKLAQQKPAGR